MSKDDQDLFSQSALKAAQEERSNTIEDTDKFINNSTDFCKGFFNLEASELEKFQNLTKNVYKSNFVKNNITPGLIKKIISA